MIPLSWYLILAAAMVCIGLFGVIARRNAIAMLLSVELILNAVNINLLAFWRYVDVVHAAGQVFVVMVITAAAAEVAVGLAIIIAVYRKQKTIVTDDVSDLKG
ncbi:MAG: NADH-quinone oxidoreductase subunit NuoK [Anaerolinea sp.]|nr:NADH-quinone oxidoreductase subunit NuoK [Anaerolinea sp.]